MVHGAGAQDGVLRRSTSVVMLRVLDLRPVPFVVSFTGYFIALHTMEALFLRRLFDDLRSPTANALEIRPRDASARPRSRDRRRGKPQKGSTPAKSSSSTSPTAAIDHPLIHLPTRLRDRLLGHQARAHAVGRRGDPVRGRHVIVRRYLRQDRLIPAGFMSALEIVVEFVRDSHRRAERRPQVGATPGRRCC